MAVSRSHTHISMQGYMCTGMYVGLVWKNFTDLPRRKNGNQGERFTMKIHKPLKLSQSGGCMLVPFAQGHELVGVDWVAVPYLRAMCPWCCCYLDGATIFSQHNAPAHLPAGCSSLCWLLENTQPPDRPTANRRTHEPEVSAHHPSTAIAKHPTGPLKTTWSFPVTTREAQVMF